MAQRQNLDTIKIRSIHLLKGQTLGIGSYGKVCKAKCDALLCAAKIICETLFDPNAQQQIARHREHRLPFRRFQQECEFMSAIRHPNIVQYLGMYQDPETGLPVLLMELMDDSLTHFLESSQDSVPYHIQVNFCHDITLAISYLHSNGIIHRDLSSNNVLLRGNVIAKVTDFGMAKLSDANPRATRTSLTMIPGTDVYMPPEGVKDQPVYTTKIDCFAIGVLNIQILTRQFPLPAERLKCIQIDHPQFPGGTVDVRVPEIERRQNHISQVDPNHPLLPIALHCLKDSDVERPSAQELCHRVAALKETPQYTESVRSAQERRPEQDNTTEIEEQIRELQQQIQQKHAVIQERAQQIHGLEQIIGLKNNHLQEKDGIIREKNDENRQLQTQIQDFQQIIASQNRALHEIEQTNAAKQHENQQLRQQLEETIREKEEGENQLQQKKHECQQLAETIGDKDDIIRQKDQLLEETIRDKEEIEKQLQHVSQLLEDSQQTKAQFQTRIHKLEQQLITKSPTEVLAKPHPCLRDYPQTHHSETTSGEAAKGRLELKWRKGKRSPQKIDRPPDAVVENNLVFIRPTISQAIYTYNLTADTWKKFATCPTTRCSLAVVNNLLTTIGGKIGSCTVTNQLFSLTGDCSTPWKEVFPPMPTCRDSTTVVCNTQAVIVFGGMNCFMKLRTVEIMDITTKQWSAAENLPEPLYNASTTICGDRLYMLGGWNNNEPNNSVYTCSLADLFLSCQSRSLGEHLTQSLSLTGQAKSIRWSKAADLPVTRSTSVTLNGQLLAIGGFDYVDKIPSSDIHIYNTASNQWEVISKMTEARCQCHAAVLPNNELIVVGGGTGRALNKTDSVEIASIV